MRNLFLIAFMLIATFSLAQNQKATITFRDGHSENGYASIGGNFNPLGIEAKGLKVKFRSDKDSQTSTYDYRELSKIIIREDDKDNEYHYKIVDGKNQILLLELLKDGKVTLYRYKKFIGFGSPVTPTNSFINVGPSHNTSGYHSISDYFISKNKSDLVVNIGAKGSPFAKNFKKAASEYFKDCPELVKKIQNNVFKKNDIVDVVKFYNKKCSK